jgi:hypothetical protein
MCNLQHWKSHLKAKAHKSLIARLWLTRQPLAESERINFSLQLLQRTEGSLGCYLSCYNFGGQKQNSGPSSGSMAATTQSTSSPKSSHSDAEIVRFFLDRT